jgi:PQQ-dependent dehydrogenase (methanol/ethanol family)
LGAAFKPYYAQDRAADLGVATWPAEAWKIGGGTAWGWISYDPQLDLIYYGTANPGPWNPAQRPGANKWTSGIFARRPETGDAVWFYQTSPHDLHDYDSVNESVLVDLPIGGRTRKVLLRPDRNGYLYVIDRVTGEVISADPFVHVTTSFGVDRATGTLRYNSEKAPRLGKIVREVCPASPGGKDWQPSAWSPRTKLLYVPHQNLCQDSVAYETSYIAGTPYVGAEAKMYADSRRPARGLHGLGSGRAQESVVDRGTLSRVERRAGHRRRRRFYGTMDGCSRPSMRRTAPSFGNTRPARASIGQPVRIAAPMAISTLRCWRVWAGGRAQWSPATSTRATAAPRPGSSMR